MTKDTHIAIALATAAVVMTGTHNPPAKEIVYGSLAAVIAGPLADADILDNKATRQGKPVALSVVMYSVLPIFFYLYYQMFIRIHYQLPLPHIDVPSGIAWYGALGEIIKNLPRITSETLSNLWEIAKHSFYMIRWNWVSYTWHIGLWLAAVLAIVKTGHRTFSHSIACLIAMTAIWYTMIPLECTAKWFSLAYFSHIAVDLLNGTGEQLFWPSQKKICFHVCGADGFLNKALMFVGEFVYVSAVLNYLQ